MKTQNTEFTYKVPCQPDTNIKGYNEAMLTAFPDFPPVKTTEEHIEELKQKLVDSIYATGETNEWKFGDGVKITVNIEYEPENKQ